MKKLFWLIALTLAATANAQTVVGIASGPQTGTNWPMVEDVTKVCSNAQVTYKNVVTAGGQENYERVLKDKTTQYGVVPEDVLAYQLSLDPQEAKQVVQIFPFFTTEVHLVKKAGSKINSVADLQGKRVSDGPDGSASWVTTQVIKGLTRVTWTASKLPQQASIDAVRAGTIDAAFISAGSPIKVIKETAGLDLVPIEHPALDSFKYYTKTRLSKVDYPFLSGSIPTYRINNVLAVFAFKQQYQKEIGELVSCITRKVGYMQTTPGFHAKWRTVDPSSIEAVAWPAHPAALAAIKREANRK